MSKKPSLPLTTEMRLQEQSGDEATIRNLPVSVMQALYHQITGRTETIHRDYSNDYKFFHDDVIQLVHKILQSIQQYNITGADAQFSVKYVTGEKQTFTSLEKFQQIDLTRAEKTEICEITIRFCSRPQASEHIRTTA